MNFNKIFYLPLILASLISCTNVEPGEITECSLNTLNNLAYFEDSIFSGTCNTFYADSILWKTTTYKKGKVVKEIGYYIPGGELEYVGYKKNGHIHGDFENFHKNGKIKMTGKFIKGYREGNWNYHNEEGELDSIIAFKKGLRTN